VGIRAQAGSVGNPDAVLPAAGAAAPQVFIARQPIFDRSRKVFGYELLFRASGDATTCGSGSEQATARVITDAVLAFGLDTLTMGHLAFINVTRDLLLDGMPAALPANRVVMELLEDIEADSEVLAAVRLLRRRGFAIALDDFVLTDRTADLVPFADFIKVDVQARSQVLALRNLLARPGARRSALLAEKVETVRQFESATRQGFTYFQGYFFGRPTTESTKALPESRAGHLRLLGALQDPNLSVHALEDLIRHDALLCYRILKTVNCTAFGHTARVESVRQALVMLGIDAVRRWASIWLLAGLGETAPAELVTMATVRARVCELLAAGRGPRPADGFMLGLCSLLDSILGQPIETIVDDLPLSGEVREALLGGDNDCRRLLDCAVSYERAAWDECLRLATTAGLAPRALVTAHGEALRWAADLHRAA